MAAACTELRLFRFQAVDASEVKGPFTVTLEDLTPLPGQSAPPRPVGEKGIVGHRIEKTVRLRIIVKDRDGNEPAHPVLLRLSAAGPRPGTLVFDPDGTRKECRQGLLVWHDRDAQGNVIDNDLIEYRLGTLSLLPGVEPDPDHPGQVRPVWGVAEVLSIASEAITTETTAVNRQAIPVRPLPGKPHSLVDWDGSAVDDGYYALAVKWWALNGQMPVGNYPLELAVAYPADPDWPAGEVLGWTNVRLQGGNQTHLKSYGRYEARYGLDDGAFPLSVSPGARETAIPRVGPPEFGSGTPGARVAR